MRAMTLTSVLLLVGALSIGMIACQGGEERAEEAAVEETTGVSEHMQEHFTRAVALRDAVIDGELDAGQDPARWMSDHEMEGGVPEGWEPYLAEMQVAAAGAVEATDLQTAATAAGTMAAQCGACHQAQGAMFELPIGEPPADAPGTEAHMERHLWAMESLWNGLITPSDAPWAAGAEVLAEEALAGGTFSEDPQLQAQLAELASRVHALGAEAATVSDLQARGQLYGQLLGTCAPCHIRVAGMLP